MTHALASATPQRIRVIAGSKRHWAAERGMPGPASYIPGPSDEVQVQAWDAFYASHTEDSSGFYRITVGEVLFSMRQLEGKVHA